MRLSSTVWSANTIRPSGTSAMPRPTTLWLGSPPIASPPNVIEPADGAFTPAMARKVEVLPAPFEPMMPTNSPGPDFKIDLPHRFDPAVGHFEVFDLEQRFGHSAAPRSSITASSDAPRDAAAGAEIGLDHGGIVLNLGGRAGCNHAAVVEHGDVVGDGHHHVDVVLDQDDRDAAVREQADQRLETLDLAVREARGRLVEQQEPRLERERARDLEPALVAERQIARLLRRVVGEADEVEQLARLRAEARSSLPKRGSRSSVSASVLR